MTIKSADVLDDRGKRLIGRYLLGGTAAGGSLALATSLINYYKTLKEEADMENDTSKDDDVLYINLKRPGGPNPVKTASVEGGLALTGGALAALGTYATVRKLYQKFKQKRFQRQLDEAQQAYFDVLDPEVEKTASDGKPMGPVELFTSLPVSLSLLAALSSGALTYRALNKYFPEPTRKRPLGPKRIVIRKQEDPSFYDSIEENDEYNKSASYDSRNASDVYKDGLEFLVHMCLGNTKCASVSDLHNLVGAIIDGRKQEFIGNCMELGFDAAMSMCKGAYENIKSASAADIGLAVGICVHTPELEPITSLLAASEYKEMAPHFTKMACYQPPKVHELLCKIAGALGAFGRANIFRHADLSVKRASYTPLPNSIMPFSVEQVLDMMQSEGGEEAPAGEMPMGDETNVPGDDGQEEDPTETSILSSDGESSLDYTNDDSDTGYDETEETEEGELPAQAGGVNTEAPHKDQIDSYFDSRKQHPVINKR